MFNINDIIERADEFAHKVLGDPIIIQQPNGETAQINAMFEWRNEEDEIGSKIDDTHPILEEILAADTHLFEDWSNITVVYRGSRYSVEDFNPKHDRNSMAVLRPERVQV